MTQIDYFETADLLTYLNFMKNQILEQVCWDQEVFLENTFIVRLKDLKSYRIYYLYQNEKLLYNIQGIEQ